MDGKSIVKTIGGALNGGLAENISGMANKKLRGNLAADLLNAKKSGKYSAKELKNMLAEEKGKINTITNLVEGGVNVGTHMGAGMAVGGVVGGVVGAIDEDSSVGEGIARGIGFGALGGIGTGIGVTMHNKGLLNFGKDAKLAKGISKNGMSTEGLTQITPNSQKTQEFLNNFSTGVQMTNA